MFYLSSLCLTHTLKLSTRSQAFNQLQEASIERQMKLLRLEGYTKLFSISSVDTVKKQSVTDLYLTSRIDFPEERDFLKEIIIAPIKSSTNLNNGYLGNNGFFAFISIFSVLLQSIVLPSNPFYKMQVDSSVQNVIGLFLLSLPFLLLILSQTGDVGTKFIVKLQQQFYFRAIEPILSVFPGHRKHERSISSSGEKRGMDMDSRYRIAYHEAGHLLIGYLVGLVVRSYDLNLDGDFDGGSNCIELFIDESDRNDINENRERSTWRGSGGSTIKDMREGSRGNIGKLGSLLCMSMAGPVSECLYIKNTGFNAATSNIMRGGNQDLIAANALLDLYGIDSEDRDGYLRWCCAKCLSLLRLYGEQVDLVANMMIESREIKDIFLAIEESYSTEVREE